MTAGRYRVAIYNFRLNVGPEGDPRVDGFERLEYLHDHGASARAVHFKDPFTAGGEAYVIDREKVRKLAEDNCQGQSDLLAHVLSLKV